MEQDGKKDSKYLCRIDVWAMAFGCMVGWGVFANMILNQAGFIVDTAEDGKEAVDKVSEADAGYYDIVLKDIQMPVMDGYMATRAIRELGDKEKSKVPIIAMTANAFKEDKEAAIEAGMQEHIAKPIDVEVMLKTINHLLISNEKGIRN